MSGFDSQFDLGSLPSADGTHELEDASRLALKNALPQTRFIVREENGRDYGIDIVLELKENGNATNIKSECQLKATDNTDRNADGSVSLSVDVSNLNYIRFGASPLYVLYIRPRNELRYAWARDEHERLNQETPGWENQRTVTLRFTHVLDGDSAIDAVFDRIRREGVLVRQYAETSMPTTYTVAGAASVDAGAGVVVGNPGIQADPPAIPNLSQREIEVQALVQSARNLLRRGRRSAARDTLEEFNGEESKALSTALRYQIALLLTACFWEDDPAEAERHADIALNLQPESPKAIANMALLRLVQNRDEEALGLAERAMEIDTRVDNGAAVYIQAASALDRLADVESLVQREAWVRDDPYGAFALAQGYFERHRYAEAEGLCRTVAAAQVDNEGVGHYLLAQCLAVPIEQDAQERARWRLDAEDISRLREAREHLTRATDIAAQREQTRLRFMALALRAGVSERIGDYEDALHDCDAVLHNPDAQRVPESLDIVRITKGNLMAREGRVNDAIMCYEAVISEEQRRGILLSLATAYLEAKRPERAAELLRPSWDAADEQDRDLFPRAQLLLRAYDAMGDSALTEGLLDALRTRRAGIDDPDVMILLAEHKARIGEREEALALLREASSHVTTTGGDDRREMKLAQWFSNLQLYDEALPHFGKLVDGSEDLALVSPFLIENYVVCLYNARRYRQAAELAQRARDVHGILPKLAEVEIRIGEKSGDYKSAIALRRQLMDTEPHRAAYHRAWLAALLFEDGAEVEARAEIEQVTSDDLGDDAESLMTTAQVRGYLGLTDVIPFAYRARRAAFGDPQFHTAYVHMMREFDYQERERLYPTSVTPGCAVDLQRDGSPTVVFVIEEELEPDSGRNEIAPTDALAQRLLGLAKGDATVIRERPGGGDVTFTIANVRSKYVYAVQQTMEDFETRFPDSEGIERFEASEVGFQQLTARMAPIAERRRRAITDYKHRRLTISGLSYVLGTSVFELWTDAIQPESGLEVFCSEGTRQASEAEANAVKDSDRIVVDPLGLLTWCHVGVETAAAAAFTSIIVPQAVLDLFRQWNRAAEAQLPRFLERHRDGNHSAEDVPLDVSEAEIAWRRSLLQRVLEFIHGKTTVLPVQSLAEYKSAERKLLVAALGQGTLAAALLAHETGSILYTDDALGRAVCASEWHIVGTAAQSVLLEMVRRKKLPQEAYFAALDNLLANNYEFIGINAHFLMWILHRDGMKVTESFVRFLSRLEMLGGDPNLAIIIRSELLVHLWRTDTRPEARAQIVDHIVASFVRSRGQAAYAHLRQRIQADFNRAGVLMPLFLKDLLPRIDTVARNTVTQSTQS